jgi:hypothetical protein
MGPKIKDGKRGGSAIAGDIMEGVAGQPRQCTLPISSIYDKVDIGHKDMPRRKK